MYSLWVSLELASLLIAVISAWIAAGRLGKLRYGGSVERLHRKARAALIALAWMAVPWISALYAIAQLMLQYEPIFWRDRLFLHLPPLLIAGFAVYALTFPAVWRIWRDTATTTGAPLPPELLRRTVHPAVTAPAPSAAAAAALALYHLLVPPVPPKTAEIAIPLLMFGAVLAAILWSRTLRYRRVTAGQPAAFKLPPPGRRLLRKLGVLTVAGAVAYALFSLAAANSRLPARFSMMDGPMDFGGGAPVTHPATGGDALHASHAAHGAHALHAPAPAGSGKPHAGGTDAISVAELTGPRDETPDRRITLTAMKQTVRLDSGRTVEAWTFNGQVPGPEIRVRQGDLVEITLVNRDVEAGVTIHWHGVDVPNAEDGVAGVTQNAVMPGEKHVYRFRADQAGSFWYHTHQQSKEGVQRGLFGPLVVEPEDGAAEDVDLTVMPHIWPGVGTVVNRSETLQRVKVEPGSRVRLRLYNTDDWIIRKYVLVGAPFRVSAIDGTEVNGARELRDTVVEVTSGARMDLTFTMPDGPVLLSVDRRDLGLLFTPDGKGDAPAMPRRLSRFNPLRYGEPAPTPFGADSRFDRSFTMLLDNKLGFFNGSFDQLYTINGEVFPRTPMFVVREGDLVKVKIINRGSVDHPMHLHGHHALVLSRNREPASGSPWWTDTLDVRPGDVYELAFRANNPGLWMDHCHNLAHAAIGMTMHLMYEGVYTPYEAGADTGNLPE